MRFFPAAPLPRVTGHSNAEPGAIYKITPDRHRIRMSEDEIFHK